jgi:DNA-binding MarR family transcriptional regulator
MKKSSAQPGSNDHALTLCHMLSNRIGKAFAAELESRDVTIAEWRVLLTLAQYEPVSGKEITGRWAMDKMAVNRAISSLQMRDLIKKKINSADKRVIDLMLSTSGRTLYDQLLPIANERYHKLLAGLNSIEEKQLRATLLKLIIHVDEMAE